MRVNIFTVTITDIKREGNIFTVTFRPSFIGKFFGKNQFTKKYKKDSINTYRYGDGGVYYRPDGSTLGNNNWIGEALDNHSRSWK